MAKGDAVVIESTPMIRMESDCVAVFWAASVTVKVMLVVPAAVGLPVIAPVFASSARPAGSAVALNA